ncbi:MAG: ubiquinol-cytochrome c reductase iron-sulfur subunit [Syntrophomonadaceae bacterium]
MRNLTEVTEVLSDRLADRSRIIDKKPQSRRTFIKRLLGLGLMGFAASVLYPLMEYLKPPKQREVEVNSQSAGKIRDYPLDSGKIIRFGNKPVIVIRTKEDTFKAFSASCTHLNCTVQYRGDMDAIWCACHNGKYDLTGRNISGPPPRPLDEFKTMIKNDEVIIIKKA